MFDMTCQFLCILSCVTKEKVLRLSFFSSYQATYCCLKVIYSCHLLLAVSSQGLNHWYGDKLGERIKKKEITTLIETLKHFKFWQLSKWSLIWTMNYQVMLRGDQINTFLSIKTQNIDFDIVRKWWRNKTAKVFENKDGQFMNTFFLPEHDKTVI